MVNIIVGWGSQIVLLTSLCASHHRLQLALPSSSAFGWSSILQIRQLWKKKLPGEWHALFSIQSDVLRHSSLWPSWKSPRLFPIFVYKCIVGAVGSCKEREQQYLIRYNKNPVMVIHTAALLKPSKALHHPSGTCFYSSVPVYLYQEICAVTHWAGSCQDPEFLPLSAVIYGHL